MLFYVVLSLAVTGGICMRQWMPEEFWDYVFGVGLASVVLLIILTIFTTYETTTPAKPVDAGTFQRVNGYYDSYLFKSNGEGVSISEEDDNVEFRPSYDNYYTHTVQHTPKWVLPWDISSTAPKGHWYTIYATPKS